METFKKTGVGFEFNPNTHRYYLDGTAMTGVTTILGVIAKPQLIKWSADMAVDYLLDNSMPTDLVFKKDDGVEILLEKDNRVVSLKTLEEARKAWSKKRDDSADLGKEIHSDIEQYIKAKIAGESYTTDKPQVQHFINWADKHNVQFIASEEQVYSVKLFVAGTYDFSCIIDGRKYLCDLKTGNALYPEYFYQCASYRMMAEEMGQTDFKGSILVRIGRDGKFNEDEDVIISESYEDEKEAFLSAHTLYRITQKYETKRKGSKAL